MLKGIGVSGGVGIGRIFKVQEFDLQVPTHTVAASEEEIQVFRSICQTLISRNQALIDEASAKADESCAEIFEAHITMLEDEDSFILPVEELIRQTRCNAAQAAHLQLNSLAEMLSGLDAYMKERVADIRDLDNQILALYLHTEKVDLTDLPENTILLATDLTPSQTVNLDADRVCGIVCEAGGKMSHAVILAKAMGIPAVMGCQGAMEASGHGEAAVLDGDMGCLILSPSQSVWEEYKQKAFQLENEKQHLEKYLNVPCIPAGGSRRLVFSNIAAPQECGRVIARGAEGIGLFRSEFLFMNRDTLPDEEEQFEAYKQALLLAEGREVTIRTIDAGGDKELPLLDTEPEENPFLGYRAIRICLDRKDMFLTQLRALLRASIYGELRILIPMLSSLEELRAAKDIFTQAKEHLRQQGVAFREDVPLGIMVEVPAVAITAEVFAKEADFFSIGTNDLTQYTTAVDRGNKTISHLYTHYHPAVIRLIHNTIQGAHKAGIPCGMCGEAASDQVFIPLLVGMGLDEFSVAPASVLATKRRICKLDMAQAKDLLSHVMQAATAEDVKRLLES